MSIKQYFRHRPKSYDRTELVRKVLKDPSIIKAIVYIDYTTVLRYKYAGRYKPKARRPKEIVKGWLVGYEWARQVIKRYGRRRWYWVKYPAKLYILKIRDFKHRPKSYDRTELVKRVLRDPSITKAIVHINYSKVLDYKYAGHSQPSPRNPKDIVKGWLKGYEWARQRTKLGNEIYWYWVKYPAKLEIIRDNNKSSGDSSRVDVVNVDIDQNIRTPEFEKFVNNVKDVIVKGDLMTKIIVGIVSGVVVYFVTKKVLK